MNTSTQILNAQVLNLDYEAEATRICARLREATAKTLRKRGLVVAVSGGIDSSTCLGLAVRALGPERVFALIMPERDSADDSAVRAKELIAHLGVQYTEQDIAATLDAIGCYRWRDEAVRRAVPEFGDGWKFKIVITGGVEGRVNVFHIVAHAPDGREINQRLGLQEYLTIVAATNFKQRIRKTLEYFHADRLNYGVVGTPNLLEYDQGFFAKNGDGSADVKPISHLYKTQVYGMARHLGLPARVVAATPTTDTYSLPQGQDEFYFALPYAQMDLALWALNHAYPAEKLAQALAVSVERAAAIYADIENKRRTTQYLHLPPVRMDS